MSKPTRSHPTSASAQKTAKWKKILVVVTASALTLALGVLGAEIYLRSKARVTTAPADYAMEFRTHRGQKISELEGGLKLSLAPFTVYKNLPSQHTPVFNINSRGLRADEHAELDSSPKLIFLGGSAAFGYGARDDRETIEYALEQSVKPYRVLNAGVNGFLSGQELTYLVTELVDYDPSVVVAYDGWNDLFDSIYSNREDDELGFNNNFFSIEERLRSDYETRVSLYRSLGRLAEATLSKSLLYGRVTQRFRAMSFAKTEMHMGRLDAIVTAYAGNLRKMALVSRACGARFVVVFQPELGQKPHRTPAEQRILDAGIPGTAYRDEFPEAYREFLAKAKQLLTRDGVEWIDINESTKFAESTDELFMDVVHTNGRGNKLVAEIIGQRLNALSVDENKPAPKTY